MMGRPTPTSISKTSIPPRLPRSIRRNQVSIVPDHTAQRSNDLVKKPPRRVHHVMEKARKSFFSTLHGFPQASEVGSLPGGHHLGEGRITPSLHREVQQR